MLYILFTIIGILIGFIPTYIICWKKPKAKIIEKNIEAQEYNNKLWQEKNKLQVDIASLTGKKNELTAETLKLREQKEEFQYDIESLKSNLEKTNEILIAQANDNFEHQMNLLGESYQAASDDYMRDYENMMLDLVHQYQEQVQNLENLKEEKVAQDKITLEKLEAKLVELQTKVDSTVEVLKREELERTQKDFYRLILSKEDLEEIANLRSIKLRDPTALNKVIWKVYYEKPYTDLIGRVVGKEKKTGIYKITNLNNGMCYVGQAVDIAERFRQHIKRGLGADTPTKNKLYPAMIEFGVENFTFEIIEECDRSLLDSREDYYQDVFHTKDYGYSIK